MPKEGLTVLTEKENAFFFPRDEEEVEVELGSADDELIPGEVVYDADADDAGSLFDFDDDL